MQEKYLLSNGLELKCRLNRSSLQFCLMSEDSPAKSKIDTAILRVRNVQLLPAIGNELNQTIAHHNAKFPIRRVEVKTFTIRSGTRSKIEDRLLRGQLPKRVCTGLVTNEAFDGTLDTNPFFISISTIVKWMLLVADIVSMEKTLNLNLEVISICLPSIRKPESGP